MQLESGSSGVITEDPDAEDLGLSDQSDYDA
jgi:hypothetical protein